MRGAQSGQFVIPANSRLPVDGLGQFIRCLEANGVFTVSVDNGQEMYFASGISYTSPDFEDYKGFALINRTAAPVTVIIAWGFGTVTDNRLTATGNLFVINAPATTLKVDDDETQAQLLNVQNLFKSATEKRTALSSMGAAHAGAGSVTAATLISPAANTNGVVINRAILAVSSTNGGCALYADTAAPASLIDTSKKRVLYGYVGITEMDKDIYIPAGTGVYFVSYAATPESNVTVEYTLL